MIGKFKLTLLGVILFALFAPFYRALADGPFLRWERGQVQEVVLGGVALENNWEIQLQGDGLAPLIFAESDKSETDYIVFSLMIPDDQPVGPYTVVAVKPGGEIKVIATVQMLGVEKYEVIRVPRDLAFIVGILIFITAFASTLRAKKYSVMSFSSTQQIFKENFAQEKARMSIAKRISSAPYLMRTRAISNFETSLFKFLMLREGELIHRISKPLYSFLPFVGFAGGMIAANETNLAGGIASASLAVFIAMALIGILDAYSGVFAVLGFWFIQLSLGNISSFRDILLMLAVAIGWLAPVLAFTVASNTIPRDLSKSTPPSSIANSIGIFVGALFGASTFYFGHKLINSILIEIGAQREVSLITLAIISGALVVRGIADQLILGQPKEGTPLESITIARVNSPQTAFGVMILVFGFVYLWTQSSQSALMAAGLFATPYILLLIRFNKFRLGFLSKIPRNILIESLVITAIGFYIFREISSAPFLVGEKSRQFLILAGLPGIVHAIYSVACDSANRVEILEQ